MWETKFREEQKGFCGLENSNCKVQPTYLKQVHEKKRKIQGSSTFCVCNSKAGIAFCSTQNANPKVRCPDMPGL